MTAPLAPPPATPPAPPTASLSFTCPVCRATLAATGPTKCPHCDWRGEAYSYAPNAVTLDAAEAALPDDAVCLHHPSKRATTTCAGTGDYICALCAVDLDGQTYSTAYLDSGGLAVARKAFTNTLARPDGRIYLYLILILIPGINYITIPFAFVWLPHAFFLYFKALRQRRENPLFARVMGRGSVIAIPILLTVVSLLWIAGVIALGWAISRSRI